MPTSSACCLFLTASAYCIYWCGSWLAWLIWLHFLHCPWSQSSCISLLSLLAAPACCLCTLDCNIMLWQFLQMPLLLLKTMLITLVWSSWFAIITPSLCLLLLCHLLPSPCLVAINDNLNLHHLPLPYFQQSPPLPVMETPQLSRNHLVIFNPCITSPPLKSMSKILWAQTTPPIKINSKTDDEENQSETTTTHIRCTISTNSPY